MVSVGVGSGEWQELDSPRERDEPNLIILLRAPVIFRLAPFMLAIRTNKNDPEQLDSGYVSELKMKLLPESCFSKCVDNLAAKKWERESFLAIKLEPKSNGNPSKNVWEGVRVERVSMRAHHPSLGLYLKEFGRVHPRKSQAQQSSSRWRRWRPGAVGPGSADLCGQPTPGWAPWCPPFGQMLPQRLWTLEIWCTAKSLLEKMSKLLFPKDFKTQKIFLVFL